MRRVVVGLLMLATLLTYAAPGGASPLPHSHAPHEQAAHFLAGIPGDAGITASAAEDGACAAVSLAADNGCCSVAQCVTMHGAIPPALSRLFVPRLDASNVLYAQALPDGIGGAPALRPPSLIV